MIEKAKDVLLSAGALHSPKILMHSGIGPAGHLEQHGIPVIVDAPDVGENLQDHPTVPLAAFAKGDVGYQEAAQGLGAVKTGLRYSITKDGPASGNGIEAVSYWDPDDNAAEPTIQCYHVPIVPKDGLTPAGTRSGITFELVVLQPRSRGSVRLADAADVDAVDRSQCVSVRKARLRFPRALPRPACLPWTSMSATTTTTQDGRQTGRATSIEDGNRGP